MNGGILAKGLTASLTGNFCYAVTRGFCGMGTGSAAGLTVKFTVVIVSGAGKSAGIADVVTVPCMSGTGKTAIVTNAVAVPYVRGTVYLLKSYGEGSDKVVSAVCSADGKPSNLFALVHGYGLVNDNLKSSRTVTCIVQGLISYGPVIECANVGGSVGIYVVSRRINVLVVPVSAIGVPAATGLVKTDVHIEGIGSGNGSGKDDSGIVFCRTVGNVCMDISVGGYVKELTVANLKNAVFCNGVICVIGKCVNDVA
jgi:hypothetical protein